MDNLGSHFRSVLFYLESEKSPKEAFLNYVQALERQYATSQDITLYVYAVRCFFSWHRANQIFTHIEEIRNAWVEQNEKTYGDWLTSMDDSPEELTWEKWTFQAKMAILTEFHELFRNSN